MNKAPAVRQSRGRASRMDDRWALHRLRGRQAEGMAMTCNELREAVETWPAYGHCVWCGKYWREELEVKP